MVAGTGPNPNPSPPPSAVERALDSLVSDFHNEIEVLIRARAKATLKTKDEVYARMMASSIKNEGSPLLEHVVEKVLAIREQHGVQ